MNLKEAKIRIKEAGSNNVRVVPMPGESFEGDHQIEINQGGVWTDVVSGLKKAMAESIVRESINRVILG